MQDKFLRAACGVWCWLWPAGSAMAKGMTRHQSVCPEVLAPAGGNVGAPGDPVLAGFTVLQEVCHTFSIPFWWVPIFVHRFRMFHLHQRLSTEPVVHTSAPLVAVVCRDVRPAHIQTTHSLPKPFPHALGDNLQVTIWGLHPKKKKKKDRNKEKTHLVVMQECQKCF